MKGIVSIVLTVMVLWIAGAEVASGQTTVPGGINYQAVARDNNGDELVNTDIEVRFSIKTGSPTGPTVYQEVFTDVTTSRYGVFSLIIGKGDPVIGTFTGINWSTTNHYLQVEVKFENIFMDMGTMQFMAVPYALYAGKSLEPGPAGPKGDPGPQGPEASDDQQLSYTRGTRTLSLTNGGSVVLGTEVAFRALKRNSAPTSTQINITMTYDAPDLSIGGGFNPETGIFTVPADGIYTFNVSYYADGEFGQDGRKLFIFVNSAPYENIATGIMAFNTIGGRSVTARLTAGDTVTVVVFTASSNQTGTGSFSGYKVD